VDLILGRRITQNPSFSIAFFTARLTRFLERSTALPSRALCQYLLIKISLQTILVLGRSNLNLIISALMSWIKSAVLYTQNHLVMYIYSIWYRTQGQRFLLDFEENTMVVWKFYLDFHQNQTIIHLIGNQIVKLCILIIIYIVYICV
jgi:hypothetical protein